MFCLGFFFLSQHPHKLVICKPSSACMIHSCCFSGFASGTAAGLDTAQLQSQFCFSCLWLTVQIVATHFRCESGEQSLRRTKHMQIEKLSLSLGHTYKMLHRYRITFEFETGWKEMNLMQIMINNSHGPL